MFIATRRRAARLAGVVMCLALLAGLVACARLTFPRRAGAVGSRWAVPEGAEGPVLLDLEGEKGYRLENSYSYFFLGASGEGQVWIELPDRLILMK